MAWEVRRWPNESVLSFYYVGPLHPTQGTRLGSKCSYLMNHTLSPTQDIKSKISLQTSLHSIFLIFNLKGSIILNSYNETELRYSNMYMLKCVWARCIFATWIYLLKHHHSCKSNDNCLRFFMLTASLVLPKYKRLHILKRKNIHLSHIFWS